MGVTSASHWHALVFGVPDVGGAARRMVCHQIACPEFDLASHGLRAAAFVACVDDIGHDWSFAMETKSSAGTPDLPRRRRSSGLSHFLANVEIPLRLALGALLVAWLDPKMAAAFKRSNPKVST